MSTSRFTRGIACALVCALIPPPLALAQSASDTPTTSSASAPAEQTFTQAELDQMLAPIALYPDALLSQVLMASTYPLEVVQADRWVKQHKGLKGTALQNALASQPWDASVKSLCAFPPVLDRMSRDLNWTEKLGEAFVDQQQQVMDTVQDLRTKAQAAGTLKNDSHQRVVVEDGYISILPADPQVVYVPTYDPRVVYGAWWWPAYPPYYPVYWGPPPGAVLADGFFWGVGIAAGLALWGVFDWHRHAVHVDVNRYNVFNRTHITDSRWHFDPAHRHGAPFHGAFGQSHFGAYEQRAARAREQFRSGGASFAHPPRAAEPHFPAAPHTAEPHFAPAPHAAEPHVAADHAMGEHFAHPAPAFHGGGGHGRH